MNPRSMQDQTLFGDTIEISLGEPGHVDNVPPIARETEIVQELITDRRSVYGHPEDVFVRHAQVWSGVLGVEVRPDQVALCMMAYKLVRTSVTPDYSDNSDDIEGYLDIFRGIIGEGMIHARDTEDYARQKNERR